MVGTTLDSRYRLERELHADPDSVEYAGLDLRLQRPVRVRVLRADRAVDATYVAAWRDALTRQATLSHPHVLALYDVCLSGGPVAYVVESAVDGDSLADWLRRGDRPDPAAMAALAEQCARALGAAHAAGLIHGHFSPASILVDAQGDAFLTGFGLPRGPAPTREQARYLAPEEAVGDAPSPRTDVYGLAATLYEAVSGRPPFDGPNAVAIGTLKNTSDAPPLPAGAGPRPLLDAIRNGLARHPLARPADGSAFAAALGQAASPLPNMPSPNLTQTVVLPRTAGPSPAAPAPPMAPAPPSRPVPAPVPAREGGGCTGAFVALLLLAGIAGALWYAFKHPGGNLQVPMLVNRSEAEARKLVEGLGLHANIQDMVYDDNVPDGHVVSQDPPGDTKLNKGDTVKLVMSKGPRFVTVPSLKGLSEKRAKTAIDHAGLCYGGSEQTEQPDVADGVVTAQQPPAGSKVEKNTTVQLFVNHPPKGSEAAPATATPADKAPPSEAGTKPPADNSKPGLVDQALDAAKAKAGEVVSDAAKAAKEKAGEVVSDAAKAAKDAVRRQFTGGDKPDSGGKKPGE